MARKPLIFIVDDSASASEAIEEFLKANGFAVRAFAGASELLKRRELSHVGCLVLDVQMPDMGGLELSARLVASGVRIPTIFITAFPQDADRRHALASGAADYLAKPFRPRDLLRAIRLALETRNRQ
jgi:FixJ family two-component response regulator